METTLSQLSNIMHFLIVLGLAVIFHEWGHFIVAKVLGAKVDRFAVGFGPKLFSHTWHETEYAVCALPLGGYVKIRGMDPDDETTGSEWEFLQLSPWKRILIVFAGPFMNFVLAFLIYVFLFAGYGESYISTTTIGQVPFGTYGWEMGLRDGDQVVSVNDREIKSWNDVLAELNEFIVEAQQDPSKNILTVQVQREGQLVTRSKAVPLALLKSVQAGDAPQAPETYEGIFVSRVLPGGVFDQAGLKPGIIIKSADGKTFRYRQDWSDYFSSRFRQNDQGQNEAVPVTIEYVDADGAAKTATLTPDLVTPAPDALPNTPKTKIDIIFEGETSVKEYLIPSIALLGFAPKLPPVVGGVQENSPADKAGITGGSRIVELNDQPVDDWVDVLLLEQDSLQENENGEVNASPLKVAWMTPDNEMKSATLTPNVERQNLVTQTSMKTGKRYAIAQIGMDPQADRRKMGIVGAVVAGWERLLNMCIMMVTFLFQLFTGQASPKLLGGPIAIYQMSGEYGRWGMERFLSFIALLSANLGLLNLFPLPPLDGGHIVFYSYEMIRRKPITMKQMENFGKIGFALIIPLILFTLFNDLSRLDLFSWLKDLFS